MLRFLELWDKVLRIVFSKTIFTVRKTAKAFSIWYRTSLFWMLNKDVNLVQLFLTSLPIEGQPVGLHIQQNYATKIIINGIVFSGSKSDFEVDGLTKDASIEIQLFGFKKTIEETIPITFIQHGLHMKQAQIFKSFNSVEQSNKLRGFILSKAELNPKIITKKVQLSNLDYQFKSISKVHVEINTNQYYQIYEHAKNQKTEFLH